MSVCATKRETERLTNRNPGHAPLQMHSSGRAGCPRIGTGPLDVWPGKQERRRNCFQTCFRHVSDVFQTCFRRVSDVFQMCFRQFSVQCARLSHFLDSRKCPGIIIPFSLMFHSCFTPSFLAEAWRADVCRRAPGEAPNARCPARNCKPRTKSYPRRPTCAHQNSGTRTWRLPRRRNYSVSIATR